MDDLMHDHLAEIVLLLRDKWLAHAASKTYKDVLVGNHIRVNKKGYMRGKRM